MARSKALEVCFLCEEAPCRCRELARAAQKAAQKPREKPAPKTPTVSDPVEDPWPSTPAAPIEPVRMPEPIRSRKLPAQQPRAAKLEAVVSEDELETRRALMVLIDENMLVVEDVVSLQSRLGLPDWKIQAYVWRNS